MAYMLYSLSFLFLIITTGMRLSLVTLNDSILNTSCIGLYITRSRWLHLLPVPDYIYQRLPSSFAADMESGFTSSDFDLSANVASGDSRAGLDQQGKRAVQRIMQARKVGFDEARRMYTEQNFAKNNIGPDGRPRDPKFISFS